MTRTFEFDERTLDPRIKNHISNFYTAADTTDHEHWVSFLSEDASFKKGPVVLKGREGNLILHIIRFPPLGELCCDMSNEVDAPSFCRYSCAAEEKLERRPEEGAYYFQSFPSGCRRPRGHALWKKHLVVCGRDHRRERLVCENPLQGS